MRRTAARRQKAVRVSPAGRGTGGTIVGNNTIQETSYRKTFERFSPDKISRYTKSDVDSLLKDPGIIRNRKKVESFVNNAKRFLEVKDEFGTFDEYIW